MQRISVLGQDLWFLVTIITGHSQKLLLDILHLPQVMEILQRSFHRTNPFMCSSGI